jgi:hypothetical protein
MHTDKQFKKIIHEVKRLALSGVELRPHVIGIARDGRILEVIHVGGNKIEFYTMVADFFQACEIQKYYFIAEFNAIDAVPRKDGIVICQATRNTNLLWTSEIQHEPEGHRRLVDPQFTKNTSGNITKLLRDTDDPLTEDRKISLKEFMLACRLPNGIILWPLSYDVDLPTPHPKQALLGNVFRSKGDKSNVPSINDIKKPKRDPKPNERFENTILLAKSLLLSTGELVPTAIGFQKGGRVIQFHYTQEQEEIHDLMAAYDVEEIHLFHRFVISPGKHNFIFHGAPVTKSPDCKEGLVVIALTPEYRWRWNCRIVRNEHGLVECLSNFAWHESPDLFIFEGIFAEKNNQIPEKRKKAIKEYFASKISNTYEAELHAMQEFAHNSSKHMHVLTATSEFAIRKMHGLDTTIPDTDPESEWGRIKFPDGRIAYLGMKETGNYYRFSPNVDQEAFAAENGPGLFAILLDIKDMAVELSALAPRSTIFDHAEYRDFGFGPQLSIDCTEPGLKLFRPNNSISTDETAKPTPNHSC